jgi:hypothetical protein
MAFSAHKSENTMRTLILLLSILTCLVLGFDDVYEPEFEYWRFANNGE